MPSLFISRHLQPDSPFWSLGPHWQICHQSLVAFTPLAFEPPPPHDWVFFYSKQAVDFYYQGLQRLSHHPQPSPKLATLGAGTAQALAKYGLSPQFVGNGNPAAVAADFIPLSAGQRVLFPRASQSRQSIAHLLGTQLEALDLIVYHNTPIPHIKLPPCDYLVFTSPLNAQTYLSAYPISPHQKIIAIGQTTAITLSQSGVTKLSVAAQATEAALVETILTLTDL